MTRWAWVVVALIGCKADTSELERRLDAVERERLHASVFFEENRKLLEANIELRKRIEALEVGQRFWYCSYLAGIQGPNAAARLDTFGTCYLDRKECGSSPGTFVCVPTTVAWCGVARLCFTSKRQCEAATSNAPCVLVRPDPE